MKKSTLLVNSAITGLLTLGASLNQAYAADKPAMEKCAGVVKAGKNDCQTNTSACAGTSAKDGQKDAWLYLPKGSCEKIVGGTVLPDTKKK